MLLRFGDDILLAARPPVPSIYQSSATKAEASTATRRRAKHSRTWQPRNLPCATHVIRGAQYKPFQPTLCATFGPKHSGVFPAGPPSLKGASRPLNIEFMISLLQAQTRLGRCLHSSGSAALPSWYGLKVAGSSPAQVPSGSVLCRSSSWTSPQGYVL